MKGANRVMSHRKKSSNELREGERIADRFHLANMAKWTHAVAERIGGDKYQAISKMCGKSKAWWSHVDNKRFDRIKPTPTEYRAIKLLYDAVLKFGGDTSGRRELAYRILGDMGELQRDVAELMRKA